MRLAALRYIYMESGWRKTFFNWKPKKWDDKADKEDAFQNGIIEFDKEIRSGTPVAKGKLKWVKPFYLEAVHDVCEMCP